MNKAHGDILRDAIEVMLHAHMDQKYGDRPFLEHPLSVAASIDEVDFETVVTALLHDTVEDSDVTLDHLRGLRIPENIVSAVELLTHEKAGAEEYFAYIRKIKNAPGRIGDIAREVKKADAKTNHRNCLYELQITDPVDEQEKWFKFAELAEKYEAVLAILYDRDFG